MSRDEAYSDTVDEGYVVSWNPSGSQESGTEITVVISLGPEESEPESPSSPNSPSSPSSPNSPESPSTDDIPEITGMKQSDAEKALIAAGYNYSITYADGTQIGVDPDHVISWSVDDSGIVRMVVAWSDSQS